MKPFLSEYAEKLGVRWNVTVWYGHSRRSYGFHSFDNAMEAFRMECRGQVATRVEIEAASSACRVTCWDNGASST